MSTKTIFTIDQMGSYLEALHGGSAPRETGLLNTEAGLRRQLQETPKDGDGRRRVFFLVLNGSSVDRVDLLLRSELVDDRGSFAEPVEVLVGGLSLPAHLEQLPSGRGSLEEHQKTETLNRDGEGA